MRLLTSIVVGIAQRQGGKPRRLMISGESAMMRCAGIRRQGTYFFLITATEAGYAEDHSARSVVLRGRLFGLRKAHPASGSAFTG